MNRTNKTNERIKDRRGRKEEEEERDLIKSIANVIIHNVVGFGVDNYL